MPDSTSKPELRKLPSVDTLLRTQDAAEYIAEYGRPLTIEAIRYILEEIRKQIIAEQMTLPVQEGLMSQVGQLLQEWTRPSLESVVNATGVILHTNLGRAPLSEDTINAMRAVALAYSSLEYDLKSGKRGSRYVHAEELLVRLTGAEAGLVVNNNASALLLILSALARKKRVLISRTQLIEIGGGFRIPEIMQQSGAVLEEIGATNRVHLEDYQRAIEDQPVKLVLRAHRSNFQLVGFTAEPETAEIVELAHKAGLPFVDDLGSGSFLDTAVYGLEHETTIQESLAAGADLVCFSGDKLLGGPQAGIIIGKKELVDKLRKHPMARAIRADKLALAGLSATLLHYLKDEAERKIPIWQMIAMPVEMIDTRARKWARMLGQGEIIAGESTIGGGSLPGQSLPTILLALSVERPDAFLAYLRGVHPPVIARVEGDAVVLDPRTVMVSQEGALIVGLQNALSNWR